MKAYKSSDLTQKRAEVFAAARSEPVIITQCRTNGDIIDVFVLMRQPDVSDDEVKKLMKAMRES